MLKKLAPTIFMLICALFATASAQTQTSPDKQAAVKELVSLMMGNNKMEDMMTAMVPQMQAQQDAILKSSLDARNDLTAAEKQALADSYVNDRRYSLKRMMDKMVQKFNYNEMMVEITSSLLDKYYTLEEVKDLTAFYRTPTGQKALKVMTPMMTDTMVATQERVMPKIMLVITEMMDEDKAEIAKRIDAAKPKTKRISSK